MSSTKRFEEPSDGTITFDEAKKSLNKYATTLHGINSAVIKLGKLTVATKVYRGVSGMKLPDTFWTANEFGVKGGVENGFMSTTLDRGVAMGYAKGDGSRPGIVIEAKQGMVNRGAEISWLSQYPHEEVRHTLCVTLCASHSVRRKLCVPFCASHSVLPALCVTLCASHSVRHRRSCLGR